MIYRLLSKISPTQSAPISPRRIVFIRPCCIGDVVMATGALSALRNAYPSAHITWAIGEWSRRAIENHPAINDFLDTGSADLPIYSLSDFRGFVNKLRAGEFDTAISLVRSPLMSLALLLSGIPNRVGLDSLGRGFGYNLRVAVNPDTAKHEGEIYLDVISALVGKAVHVYANLPVRDNDIATVKSYLTQSDIQSAFIVAHAGGGSNPGMQMDSKRYPPHQLAQLLNRLGEALSASIILIGAESDKERVQAVAQGLTIPSSQWIGKLSFQEIGALAQLGLLYIGNDTGLTHLAAAVGAKTVMIMGPTEPQRYAPFTSDSIALWKARHIPAGGVAQAKQLQWDWARDGIEVDEAFEQTMDFMRPRS